MLPLCEAADNNFSSPRRPPLLIYFSKKEKKKKELRNSIAKEYFATRANLEGENRTDRFLEIFFFRSTGRYKVVINDFVCLYECNVRGETFKFVSLSRI